MHESAAKVLVDSKTGQTWKKEQVMPQVYHDCIATACKLDVMPFCVQTMPYYPYSCRLLWCACLQSVVLLCCTYPATLAVQQSSHESMRHGWHEGHMLLAQAQRCLMYDSKFCCIRVWGYILCRTLTTHAPYTATC